MTLTAQELRWAQKDVYNAGKDLALAGLRLNNTKYHAQYRKVYEALTALNNALINDINKNK